MGWLVGGWSQLLVWPSCWNSRIVVLGWCIISFSFWCHYFRLLQTVRITVFSCHVHILLVRGEKEKERDPLYVCMSTCLINSSFSCHYDFLPTYTSAKVLYIILSPFFHWNETCKWMGSFLLPHSTNASSHDCTSWLVGMQIFSKNFSQCSITILSLSPSNNAKTIIYLCIEIPLPQS